MKGKLHIICRNKFLLHFTLFDRFIYILESFAAVSTGAGDTNINSSIGLLLWFLLQIIRL